MKRRRRSEPDRKRSGCLDLPAAELDVLACLWRYRKATARQIRETMMDYRPMTHGSVVTLLKRLETKGLVKKEKGRIGKAFVYSPTRRPEPTYRRILSNILERLFAGDGVALMASLFETQTPTPEEVEELQRLLDQLRQKAVEKGRDK